MAANVSPPRWSYNQIKKVAEQFLSVYHSELSLPIPIEDIVELRLNISIDT